MKIKSTYKLIFAVLIIAGVWFVVGNKKPTPDSGVWAPKKDASVSNTPSQLTSENSIEYLNSYHNFSFKYPKDMKIENLKEGESESEIILVQNASEGKGFQIVITPFDEEIENKLSLERIKQDVPDLTIKDPQPILIGQNGEGLAFLSDNEDFGGNSREVWFVFNGFLYQISTYAHLDPVLQSVFGTWQFK